MIVRLYLWGKGPLQDFNERFLAICGESKLGDVFLRTCSTDGSGPRREGDVYGVLLYGFTCLRSLSAAFLSLAKAVLLLWLHEMCMVEKSA